MKMDISLKNQQAEIKHIAMIMDGNGRWASRQGKPRSFGHQKGAEVVMKVIQQACQMKIKYLTLYTFSLENWGRPIDEVNTLMEILCSALEKHHEDMISKDIIFNCVGDLSKLPYTTKSLLESIEASTKMNNGLNLTLALSYTGRSDIINATRKLAKLVKTNEVDIDMVCEESFRQLLSTSMIPDPELLIRTGGERRLSNFLTWELVNTELIFLDIFWPDFNGEIFQNIIEYYRTRIKLNY